MKKLFFYFFAVSMLFSCLTGCMSPLMSENEVERMAAVDAITAQDELAYVAWDCNIWGSTRCGYPMDVRLRAIDRLTDKQWLVGIASFSIVRYDYDENFNRVRVIGEPLLVIREKALSRLMTKEGLAAVLESKDNDLLKAYATYATEHGKKSLVADGIVDLIVNTMHKLATSYFENSDEVRAYSSKLLSLADLMPMTPASISQVISYLEKYIDCDGYYENMRREALLKFVFLVANKVQTVEQARAFYPVYKIRKIFIESDEDKDANKDKKRIGNIIVTDNIALLEKGDLVAFKRVYRKNPMQLDKYFSPEFLSKFKKENRASQFIDCFTEPANSGFKLDLAMRMGSLDYLKKNLGDFDLGTKLKTSGMTLLEIALRSGETEIADYLWEKGSPAPRFGDALFWAGMSPEAAVATVEWMVKAGVKKDKIAVTPEMCFEAALVNGNTKAADELKKHFKITLSKRVDEFITAYVNNAKMPSALARENESLKFNLTHETTFDRLGQLYKNIEELEKAWFKECVKQISAITHYLIKDAKCVIDGDNYSALANLTEELVSKDFESAQRKMLRSAVETLIKNGANVNASIINGYVSKKCLSNIEALYNIEVAPTDASWEEIFRKQGWCRSEDESDKIEEEINLKLVNVMKELAKLETRASQMELEVESDEDEMYVEGFKLGIKERQRKDIYAVFYDTLKKYNKLKIVGSTTPVLYSAAEFNETDIVRLLLEKGANVPCVKQDENGETDILDTVEKKGWKEILPLLRQAYRKNNVQPVSKPAVANRQRSLHRWR